MPVYREGKNLWRLKVWHRGKPTSRMFHGSRRAADAEEARLRLELEEADHDAAPAAVPSFVEFLRTDYLPSARLRLRPSWFRNQGYMLLTLAEAFDGLALDEIGTVEIDGYARRRIDAGISPVTVNGEIRVLRRVLAVAVERGHLDEVAAAAPLPEPHRTVSVWTRDELGRLLAATADVSPHLLGIVTFLANTGARRGEALALRWEGVDLDRGLVRIWPSREWQPKSGRPREVPISDALRPWLELPRRSAYVFTTFHGRGKGGRYATWPALAFSRAVAAAELQGTPHTLRHTFAAHFLARVPDLTLLAELLGHSDTAVTRLYKHLLPDHLARARNAVQVVAPAAAADALALTRWRLERKPSGGPSGGIKSVRPRSPEIPNDSSGAGYRVRTGDIKLGNMDARGKILEFLKRTK